MGSKICLVLHRKSANEPKVKEAVQHVRAEGVKLRVRISWNKKDKPRVVNEALEDGATRMEVARDLCQPQAVMQQLI